MTMSTGMPAVDKGLGGIPKTGQETQADPHEYRVSSPFKETGVLGLSQSLYTWSKPNGSQVIEIDVAQDLGAVQEVLVADQQERGVLELSSAPKDHLCREAALLVHGALAANGVRSKLVED